MTIGAPGRGISQCSAADCVRDHVWPGRSRFSALVAATLFAWACGDGSTDPPETNKAPVASGAIPAQTVHVGETVTVSLSQYFNDPDGDALTYTAQTANANVATVSISGSSALVTGVSRGNTTVTVTASDPGGLTAQQSFVVDVPNRAPEAVGTIPDQDLFAGDTVRIDVSRYFSPEGVPGIVGGCGEGEENRGGSRGPDSGLESGSKNPNRETTTMKRKYEKKGSPDKAGLRELLAKDGRDYLLPLVNVFALAGGALDHIIDVIGRAAIEAVLDISAADVAGEKQPGKERKGAGAAYHGRQRGRVYLADRAVRVKKPRLRSPGEGEIAIPAYEALRRPSGLGERMLELLLAGLSTRSYGGRGGGRAPQGAGGAAAGRPGLSDRLRQRHPVRRPPCPWSQWPMARL